MKEKIRTLLESGKVDVFLAYKMVEGHPVPHVFSRENIEELKELVAGSVRYPLEKMAIEIIAQKSNTVVGMLARDCNQRTLNVLFVSNQLRPEQIKVVDVKCCPSKLSEHAQCSYLEPEPCGEKKKRVGVDKNATLEHLEGLGQEELFARWMYEFQKCIKCYGCRNICPVCFCRECSLENSDLIELNPLPPEVPLFHLVRAVHMAGRCVDCGLCEEACPMDIPLRLLYRKVNEIVARLFEYDPGVSLSQSPFGLTVEEPKPDLHMNRKVA
jgi:formate dehydrogenase (coenzyme F420) beta subunit